MHLSPLARHQGTTTCDFQHNAIPTDVPPPPACPTESCKSEAMRSLIEFCLNQPISGTYTPPPAYLAESARGDHRIRYINRILPQFSPRPYCRQTSSSCRNRVTPCTDSAPCNNVVHTFCISTLPIGKCISTRLPRKFFKYSSTKSNLKYPTFIQCHSLDFLTLSRLKQPQCPKSPRSLSTTP